MPKAKDIIEDWVGNLAGAVRQGTEDSGMEVFDSIFDGRSNDKPTGSQEAAQAVADAVRAHTGRRKSVDGWKPVAAASLGFKRLSKKRWEAVLEAGVAAGILQVDSDSLSYSVLVALDPEPEPDFEVDAVEKPRPRKRVVKDDDVPPSSEPPADWNPPSHLPCGHLNWRTKEENAAAQADGKCCANKGTVAWHVRGLTHPVPLSHQRTKEKDQNHGWPGLCCDPETALYIGGLANNCLHYHDGPERCIVHRRNTEDDG